MISEDIKNKIKLFYTKKKYDELIDFVEKHTQESERPFGLVNLLANAYFLKKNSTKQDIIKALNLFENAFLNEQKTINGLNAIKNLIIVGIKVSRVSGEFKKYLIKAEKFYIETEKYFENNEEFLQSGLLLFTYLLNKKKLKEIIQKILTTKNISKNLRGQSTFMTNYYHGWSQKEIFNISKKNCLYYSKLKVKKIDQIIEKKNKIINIGFVSFDLLKNHSIIYFLKDTIKFLDKSKFKIFIFSLNKKDENDQSQNELRKLANEWFDLEDASNQRVIEIIQEKKIKILFDLVGYTNSRRVEIFNSRVAPIQVSWLAYCNTTGLETVDYIFADKNLIFDNERDLYSEKIIKLPNIWNAHSGFNYKRKFNKLSAFSNNKFTFGSLNNFMKISDETIYAWSIILKEVEKSCLILKSSNFSSNEILMSKFQSYGVDNKVIILNKMNFLKHEDHLELYRKIDLCLDTFPYNGVTTTFEALWMNVPVVVLKGNNFNSRCGESIIKNLNHEFLIAKDIDDYIAKVILLTKDLEKLDNLRRNLFNNVLQSNLFNTEKFTKNFSDILLDINENYDLENKL